MWKSTPIPLSNIDFIKVENLKSSNKVDRKKNNRPLLNDLVQIKIIKGDRKLYYKLTHKDDIFQVFDFLKSKADIMKELCQNPNAPRGLQSKKKQELLDLLEYIPKKYHHSWQNLPENTSSNDLNECIEWKNIPILMSWLSFIAFC